MKYLVTNGSSVTKGGGFENYQYRQDVRDFYKSKGVEVPIQDECTYTYHLGKLLNSQPINLAKCGSGIRRLVRTSYDWINNNLNKLKIVRSNGIALLSEIKKKPAKIISRLF